jgi:transcription elongation factor Elf1
MSLWLDKKYIQFLSSQLDRFHWKHPTVANFRCPLCGDSSHNAFKSRGYLFPKQQVYIYKCHNCGESVPFAALLRRVNRHLYNEYVMEHLKEQRQTTTDVQAPPDVQVAPERVVEDLSAVSPLSECSAAENALHDVWRYATNRGIPATALHRLFGTLHARAFATPLVGEDKAARLVDGAPYLVLPLRMPDGSWYGAQFRMLSRKEYITLRWRCEPLKVFGMEGWDDTARTYILEGPIDSLFVPNALAACGSDVTGAMRILDSEGFLPTMTQRVLVWDNEPRNPEIVKHLKRAIAFGETVVVWPAGLPHKDVNDMVVAGVDVKTLLEKHTCAGLTAELRFMAWRKATI